MQAAALQQSSLFANPFSKLPPNHPTIFPQMNFQNPPPATASDEEAKRKRALEDPHDREDPVKRRSIILNSIQLNLLYRVAAAAAADKHRALHPDYVTPFSSHEDAWQRLLSYHLFHVPSVPPNSKNDEKCKCFVCCCTDIDLSV